MGKMVQIPEELYHLLLRVHLDGSNSQEDWDRIAKMLKGKELARQKRTFFAAMQDESLSPERRRAAKEMYQDLQGIHPDFRY